MGTFVWLYSPRTNSPHLTMNSFVVLSTLLAAACAAPQLVNQGPQSGPLTPVVGGDLVATPKGFRSIALEGFSEDLNEDGFVDPIAPAAPAPVVVPQPIFNTAPVAVAPQVAFPAPVATPQIAAPFLPAVRAFAPQFAEPIVSNVVNQAPVAVAPQLATPFVRAALPQVAAPVATPFFHPAAVASPVFSAPVTTVQHIAPAAPVVTRTISPLPVPVRHAPVAHVFDSRLHG